MATHYVSAKAQAALIQKMLDEEILTEEEHDFYRRGRNSKSHTGAKMPMSRRIVSLLALNR